MKVKVFETWLGSSLERQVNSFIAQKGIKVIDIKFTATIFASSAMVIYEDADPCSCQ